jgi:DNA-binding transcriptional LysR family regulator
MNLDQVEVFLALSEELHFGRTARRLHLSQPRVSRLVAALEREIGGTLFERTSRRVRLTPVGVQLRAGLAPAYAQLGQAVDAAKAATRTVTGSLRVGYTATTAGAALTRLLERFAATHPECEVVQTEIPIIDPYSPLRGNEIDVVVNWLAVDGGDLTVGPVIGRYDRVLAVSATDPLVGQESVSIEDIAQREVARGDGWPAALYDLIIPPATPSGRPIRRTVPARTITETLMYVAAGVIVHPTVDMLAAQFPRAGVRYLPIHDLPPIELGLIWLTANDSRRVQALAELAAGSAG